MKKVELKTRRIKSGYYITTNGHFEILRERTPYGTKVWCVYELLMTGRKRIIVMEKLETARIELWYELLCRETEAAK